MTLFDNKTRWTTDNRIFKLKTTSKIRICRIEDIWKQKFIDRKIVYPGDTVEAEIGIISVDYFAGQFKKKMNFEFWEGSRIIGTGQIKHIHNDKFRQASR